MSATCPWCGAPREEGPCCGSCGANYSKAEAIKVHGRAAGAVHAPAPPESDPVAEIALPTEEALARQKNVVDPELEWKLCLGAIPIALLLGIAFHAWPLGHFLQRTFLTMPLHELGHAVTAWFCGFTAFPTLWKTLTAETRGLIAPLALGGGIGYAMYRAHLARNSALLALGGVLLLVQAIGTFGLKEDTGHALITFGGDGGAMVLGTVLMGTFFFGKQAQIYQGGLRWGFLVIGAAAFVDVSSTWWAARSDTTAIPFGEIEGVGETDPVRLVEWYGWSIRSMVNRYVGLGIVCLAALAAVWALGVKRAKAERDAATRR